MAVSLKFSDMGREEGSVTSNPVQSFKPRNVIQRVSSGVTTAPVKSDYTLSREQLAVVDFATKGMGNALVAAVAGSGKTFIILEVCKALGRNVSVAIMAYNKAISVEIDAKIAKLGLTNVTVGTCHSFGLKTIRAIHRNVRIDAGGKNRRMLADIQAPAPVHRAVTKLVSLAKQSAAGVSWDVRNRQAWDDLIDRFDILLEVQGEGGFPNQLALRDALVAYSINGLAFAQETAPTIVDFDDMIWIPLIEDMQSQTFDWVIGDEVQDFNAARRLSAKRMMRPGTGRALFAGDRFQAIYSFTGADSDGVDILLGDFDAVELPLSTTYRCSKAAVDIAKRFVPHIEAGADNKSGSLQTVSMDKFEAMVASGTVGGGDAILCRMTKPLVKLCLKLIAQGVPAFVEGRNIGQSLEALTKKWDVESCRALVTCIEAHRIAETRRLMETGAEYAIEAMNDKLDALLSIMEGCDDVAQVRAKINRLFDDTQAGSQERRITLSTIHKAKGREWDRVFILGWNQLMPSRRAKQDWQIQSEINLQYVAVTRTKDALVFIDMPDRQG